MLLIRRSETVKRWQKTQFPHVTGSTPEQYHLIARYIRKLAERDNHTEVILFYA